MKKLLWFQQQYIYYNIFPIELLNLRWIIFKIWQWFWHVFFEFGNELQNQFSARISLFAPTSIAIISILYNPDSELKVVQLKLSCEHHLIRRYFVNLQLLHFIRTLSFVSSNRYLLVCYQHFRFFEISRHKFVSSSTASNQQSEPFARLKIDCDIIRRRTFRTNYTFVLRLQVIFYKSNFVENYLVWTYQLAVISSNYQ